MEDYTISGSFELCPVPQHVLFYGPLEPWRRGNAPVYSYLNTINYAIEASQTTYFQNSHAFDRNLSLPVVVPLAVAWPPSSLQCGRMAAYGRRCWPTRSSALLGLDQQAKTNKADIRRQLNNLPRPVDLWHRGT